VATRLRAKNVPTSERKDLQGLHGKKIAVDEKVTSAQPRKSRRNAMGAESTKKQKKSYN
jgi:hypothetical protein